MVRQVETRAINIVARALMQGLMLILTLEKIVIGNVVEPGPERKLAMTRSSNDNVNAKSHPESMDFAITGILICKNTVSGRAPRSSAASSSELSNERSRARTVI